MRAAAAAFCLVSVACASSRARVPGSAPLADDPPAAPAGTAWADPARDVLVQHCGRCHRSDLPTSIAGALAVFDLTVDPWFGRLHDGQYEGLLRRIRGGDDVAEVDKTIVERFVRCARDGVCEDAVP